MRRLTVGGAVMAAALSFAVPQAWAKDTAGASYAGSRDAVMDLLAVVPASPIGRAGTPMVSYVDLEAIVRAAYTGATPPPTLATVGFERAMPALTRVAAGPTDYLRQLPAIAEQLPEVLGIDVTDVHRGLTFGAPPRTGTVLGLDPQQGFGDAVAGALDARGFERRDIAGTTVFHRLGDGEMNLALRNPGDPFGGLMGQAARTALIDNVLVNGPDWWTAQSILAAAAGNGGALADDPAVAAAVAAVADPAQGGALLQLMLLNPMDTMMVPGDPVQALLDGVPADSVTPEPQGEDEMLPPYLLAALADRFAGDTNEALVAVVYPDAATAEAAATVLADRLRRFAPTTAPEAWTGYLADVGGTIDPVTFVAEGGGPAVAMARVSYPAAFLTDRAEGDAIDHPRPAFGFLVNALYRRELSVLAVTE